MKPLGTRRFRLDATGALQVAFLVLMSVCALQVIYWIFDEVSYSRWMNQKLEAQYGEQIRVAKALLDRGMDPNDVDRLFPQLTFSSGPERVTVNPVTLEEMRADLHCRRVRYGAEGAFFLVVLVAAMAVIAQALRRDLQLRRRQQNFLAAVTHEFKSPLASLKLSAETLALRDPPQPARKKLVARLLDELQRLESMISNLLDTARLEEGRMALRPERVSLAEATAAILEELTERACAAGTFFDNRVPADLDADADPVAVRTVLRNLVDNAIKACGANNGGTVHIAGSRHGRMVRLEIRDDGIGFDRRESARLFEKFYRPGDELRRTSKGSGLGLYIVQRFVQLTGGAVRAHSDGPGTGASFTVDWPAAGDAAEPALSSDGKGVTA